MRRADPARLVIELGRYLVAEAGWYLTSVLEGQTPLTLERTQSSALQR